MSSASTGASESTPDVKQWTEAELISLAEHMQQEIEIKDRQVSHAGTSAALAVIGQGTCTRTAAHSWP